MLDVVELTDEQMNELQRIGQAEFCLQGSAISARADLSAGRFDAVRNYISSVAPHLTVRRIVHKEFDDVDFERADYVMMLSTDIWVDGLDFTVPCDLCNGHSVIIDESQTIERLASKKPIVTVNGQVMVVNSVVKAAIETDLRGARFSPFDSREEYFYLLCDYRLGPLVNIAGVVLGEMKVCAACSRLESGVVCGPLQFHGEKCNDSDFAFATVVDRVVFSRSAAQLLMKIDNTLVRSDIVKLV